MSTATAALPPRLTLREHKAVWMLSQGHDIPEIAKELGILNHSVSQLLQRARYKYGQRSRYALLAHLILSGYIGLRLDCGRSRAAFQRHHQLDEPVCPACRRFNDLRNSLPDRIDLPNDVSLTLKEMQIMSALAAGDDSMAEISARTGMGRSRVGSHLTAIYAKLNIPHRDNRDRRRICLYVARQKGLVPLPDGTYRSRTGSVWTPVQARLSPKQKELLLACQDGAPLSEVAARCGIRREAAGARLSEIYRRLGLTRNIQGNEARRARRVEAYNRAREFGLLG